MYFKNIQYLGGLPQPYSTVGRVDILLNNHLRQVIFKQGSKIFALGIQNIGQVFVEADYDRSPSKGILGYVVGSIIGKKSAMLGAAIGGRKKDTSKLIIEYNLHSRSSRIVLETKDKTWELYSAINAFLY